MLEPLGLYKLFNNRNMKYSLALLINILLFLNSYSQNIINSSNSDKNNQQSAGEIFYNTAPKLSILFNISVGNLRNNILV